MAGEDRLEYQKREAAVSRCDATAASPAAHSWAEN